MSTTKPHKQTSAGKEEVQIEILFNSVEVELARRWAFGEVPEVFVKRPAEDLRKMVKQWWNIYQDSAAAAAYRDRTVWERNPSLPAQALDTPALVASLEQIRKLFNVEAIRAFRPLHDWEGMAIYLLGMVASYYINIQNQPPT